MVLAKSSSVSPGKPTIKVRTDQNIQGARLSAYGSFDLYSSAVCGRFIIDQDLVRNHFAPADGKPHQLRCVFMIHFDNVIGEFTGWLVV